MSAIESLAAPVADISSASGKTRSVRIWLFAVAALVFAMVLVGGATRLTESGLSITQWKPVTGVVPPLSEAEWQAEFARYKQIPQYSQLNPDMNLDGFKTIFYWEWSHRLLARIIGLAFILPLLWFWRKGQLAGALGWQVLAATGLLALEPIVGWWMVASGLSERVEVSQYRLALHLLIGTATFGALLWAAVGLRTRGRAAASGRFAAMSGLVAILIFLSDRPWRAGRGPARRADLQHLAADGRPADPDRAFHSIALVAQPVRRRDDRAIPAQALGLCHCRAGALAGSRRLARRAGNRAGAPRRGGPAVLRWRRRESLEFLRCCSSLPIWGGAAASGFRDAAFRHGGRPLAGDERGIVLFRFLQRALQRHADEALIGNARAPRAVADRFEKLFRQAQIDRFVLRFQFEAHDLTAGKIVYGEIGIRDELLGNLIGLKARDSFFQNCWPPCDAYSGR